MPGRPPPPKPVRRRRVFDKRLIGFRINVLPNDSVLMQPFLAQRLTDVICRNSVPLRPGEGGYMSSEKGMGSVAGSWYLITFVTIDFAWGAVGQLKGLRG